MLGIAGSAASAAEWSAQPSFSLSADVDTNRRLTDPAITSNGATFSGSVNLAHVTDMHKFSLRPRFEARRYDKVHEALDSDDMGLDLKFERQGERSSFALGAAAAEDSTLTTELADTGIVEGRARRRTLSANTDVAHSLGERFQAQAGAAYLDVAFDDAGGTGLTPYTYPSAYLGFAIEATDRSQVRVAVNSGRFEIPSARRRTDNHSVRVYWRNSLSERFSIEMNGGVNRSESMFRAAQGAVFGLMGSWRGERSSLGFTLARDVEPSALGYMVNADSVSGSWSLNVGERTSFAMSARHGMRKDLLYGLYREQREYSTLQATVTWRVDTNWKLELRAGAVSQAYELSDTNSDAGGERIALSFSWSPVQYAVSR